MKTLNRTDYKRIYNVACKEWRTRLLNLFGNRFALENEINISEAIYKSMRNACTDEQNTLFDEIFGKDEKELEVGKWYKRKDDYLWFITELKSSHNRVYAYGYGFNSQGKWASVKGGSNYDTKNLKEATKEEVKSALIKEAEKRGFVEGVKYNSLVRTLQGGETKTMSGKCTIYYRLNVVMYDNETAVLNNGMSAIFVNGKWAEIIAAGEKTYKLSKLNLNKFSKLLQEYCKENNTPATHLFMYSEGQNDIGSSEKVFYKGRKYSEMRGFEHGFKSDWDDMVVLGVGRYEDVN